MTKGHACKCALGLREALAPLSLTSSVSSLPPLNWSALRGLPPTCSFAFPWGETSTFPPSSSLLPSPCPLRVQEFSAAMRRRVLPDAGELRVACQHAGKEAVRLEGGEAGCSRGLWRGGKGLSRPARLFSHPEMSHLGFKTPSVTRPHFFHL